MPSSLTFEDSFLHIQYVYLAFSPSFFLQRVFYILEKVCECRSEVCGNQNFPGNSTSSSFLYLPLYLPKYMYYFNLHKWKIFYPKSKNIMINNKYLCVQGYISSWFYHSTSTDYHYVLITKYDYFLFFLNPFVEFQYKEMSNVASWIIIFPTNHSGQ